MLTPRVSLPPAAEQKEFDAASGVEALVVRPISAVAAVQRAGRAGRTQPGFCFRLYTREALEGPDRTMPEISEPEIRRTSLARARDDSGSAVSRRSGLSAQIRTLVLRLFVLPPATIMPLQAFFPAAGRWALCCT